MFNFNKPNEEKEITSEVEKVSRAAKVCLANKEFAEYKKRYTELEEMIIKSLINEAGLFAGDSSSLEKFGAKCLVRLIKLKDLRALIADVSLDANRGAK